MVTILVFISKSFICKPIVPDFDSLKIASFLRFDNQYVIKRVDFSG